MNVAMSRSFRKFRKLSSVFRLPTKAVTEPRPTCRAPWQERLSRLAWQLPLLAALGFTAPAQADLPTLMVSYPGPRNVSYLPIDLIPKIGADKEEGVQVKFLHTGGGGLALNNLMKRNADFAVAGLPAAMSMRANGGEVVCLAPVDDAPLFIFMVRSELKGQVKRVADLRGRVVGVNTSSLSSKTTSQQLAELVLRSDNVPLDKVRFVPAGQSWEEQSSLILSGMADAIMGDEPFASRLLAQGKVFFLTNLADPAAAKNIPGAGFLHAALETRADLLQQEPQKAEKMVRILKRTLAWMASHSPEEIAAKLDIQDLDERAALVSSLKKYSHLFSRDGRFSSTQLKETETFFHQTSEGNPAAQGLVLESMIVDRWAGRKK